MSAKQYSVTVQCDYCDEVVTQSGKQLQDANLAMLRNRAHALGWKTTSVRIRGKLYTRDYCPICSNEQSKN